MKMEKEIIITLCKNIVPCCGFPYPRAELLTPRLPCLYIFLLLLTSYQHMAANFFLDLQFPHIPKFHVLDN